MEGEELIKGAVQVMRSVAEKYEKLAAASAKLESQKA